MHFFRRSLLALWPLLLLLTSSSSSVRAQRRKQFSAGVHGAFQHQRRVRQGHGGGDGGGGGGGGGVLSCVSSYACNVRGPNLLGYYNISEEALATTVQERIEMCQLQCQLTPECQHFTWYDERGVFPHTCYLYSRCSSRVSECQGCHSGPRHCVPPSYKDCRAIETDFGGTWFCFPEISSLYSPVAHGSKCIFQCPQHITYHMCKDGIWSRPPGEKRCLCPAIGADRHLDRDGRVVCWPPRSLDEPAHAGTYCIHACHGHPKEEFQCHHGHWTTDVAALTCTPEDLNSTQGTVPEERLLEEARRQQLANLRRRQDGETKQQRRIEEGESKQDGFGYELLIEEGMDGPDSKHQDSDALTYRGTYSVVEHAGGARAIDGGAGVRGLETQEVKPPPAKTTTTDKEEKPPHVYAAPVHDDHVEDRQPERGGAFSEPKPILDVPKPASEEEEAKGEDATQTPPQPTPPAPTAVQEQQKHPPPPSGEKDKPLVHIGYKLLQPYEVHGLSHSEYAQTTPQRPGKYPFTSTTKVPYTQTTVRSQSLPVFNGIHHSSPYPNGYHTSGHYGSNKPAKTYSYQAFNSLHATYGHGHPHDQGYRRPYSEKVRRVEEKPVQLVFGTPTTPRHYSYTVQPSKAGMKKDEGGSRHQMPMPHIHPHGDPEGGKGDRRHLTSPPNPDSATEAGGPDRETNVNADVHHYSTPKPQPHPSERRRSSTTSYTTTRPTPRAPTRPPHFSRTPADYAATPAQSPQEAPISTSEISFTHSPKPAKKDPEMMSRIDSRQQEQEHQDQPVRHTLPSAHPATPEKVKKKLRYKLLRPEDFFAQAAKRIYQEATKIKQKEHAMATAEPAFSTKTSSSTSVEEVIGGAKSPKFRLQKPPIPSTESNLKPGEVSDLPLRGGGHDGVSNPFLLRKHSYRDFSLHNPYLEEDVMVVHTNLGVSSPRYAIPSALPHTMTTDYGVLYKDTTDVVHFEYKDKEKNKDHEHEKLFGGGGGAGGHHDEDEGEEVKARNDVMDNDDFSLDNHVMRKEEELAASKAAAEAVEEEEEEEDQRIKKEATTKPKPVKFEEEDDNPFLHKKKLIGFTAGSSSGKKFNDFTFPKDEDKFLDKEEKDEEDTLMEMARRKHGEVKRKKIAFGKSRKRVNKSIPENSPLWKDDGEMGEVKSKEKGDRFPNFPAEKVKKLGTLKKKLHHIKKCLHPAPVANGRLKCRGNVTEADKGQFFTHGSVCVLTCDPGFATAGEETAVCDVSGAWMSNSPLRCHESVAVVVGGWSPEKGLLADVEVFDPAKGSKCSKVRVPPLPEPRRGSVAGWVGGKVIVCGGANVTTGAPTARGRQNNKCFVYNAGLELWAETEYAMTEERHFSSAAKMGARLLVLGGRSGGEKPMALGTVESFAESEWKREGRLGMTQERAYHCAVAAGEDAVVVTGGYSYNSVVAMTEVLNGTAATWSKVGMDGNLNRARYLHGCAAVPLSGSDLPGILVAGGYSNEYLRSSELFDPRKGRWEEAGDLKSPRQGGAIAVLAGGEAVMLGGFHSMTEFPAAAERFDAEKGEWEEMKERIATPRRYFALAEVPRSLFGC